LISAGRDLGLVFGAGFVDDQFEFSQEAVPFAGTLGDAADSRLQILARFDGGFRCCFDAFAGHCHSPLCSSV
jgi:hypothetical protein